MNSSGNQGNSRPPIAQQAFALDRLGIPHFTCPRTGTTTAQISTSKAVEFVITGK